MLAPTTTTWVPIRRSFMAEPSCFRVTAGRTRRANRGPNPERSDFVHEIGGCQSGWEGSCAAVATGVLRHCRHSVADQFTLDIDADLTRVGTLERRSGTLTT